MIEYIKGRLEEKNPTYAIIEANGIGYFLHISLNTYSNIPDNENCKLLTYYSVNVDVRSGTSSHLLFGFFDHSERELFKNLISISGVSANTARMMLSSLNPSELINAIHTGSVETIKSIKGIGPKLAQRIINDLKDKLSKAADVETISIIPDNTLQEEALSALLALGFDKSKVKKLIKKILEKEGMNIAVEDVIKLALKQL